MTWKPNSNVEYDLDMLYRTLVTAHKVSVDGFDRKKLNGLDLRNWFFSWAAVIEVLMREVSTQFDKLKRGEIKI